MTKQVTSKNNNNIHLAEDLMSTNLITVKPDTLMTKVKYLFETGNIHHIPVEDSDGILVGLISKSDYLHLTGSFTFFRHDKVQENNTLFSSLLVSEVMTTDLVTVYPDTSLNIVSDILMENLFHSLPVVDKGKIVGIITTFDLLKYAIKRNIFG